MTRVGRIAFHRFSVPEDIGEREPIVEERPMPKRIVEIRKGLRIFRDAMNQRNELA